MHYSANCGSHRFILQASFVAVDKKTDLKSSTFLYLTVEKFN